MEIIGTNGPDVLNGTARGDVISGSDGDDNLNGFGGDDLLVGGRGNDNLTGGAGRDLLLGGDLSPINLVVNGSFETQNGSNNARDFIIAGGGEYAGIYYRMTNALYGWQSTLGSVLQIDTVHTNAFFNTADGAVAVDMESGANNTSDNSRLYQDIGGIAPGEQVVLSFAAALPVVSASSGASSATAIMEVRWNGALIATIVPTSTTMSEYSFLLTGDAGGSGDGSLNRIEFREIGGNADGFGTMLDAVSLHQIVDGFEADWVFYDRTAEGGSEGVLVNLDNQAAMLAGVLIGPNQARDSHLDIDTLVGIENVRGTDLADTIRGNAAGNRLDGGAGADTMDGAAGDDTFYVDNPNDVLVERPGEGFDTAFASYSYLLTDHAAVEIISLQNIWGTEPFYLTGNEYGQYLYGNQGDNELDGGPGADAMSGYGGNDIYYVENRYDLVFESAGNGYDRVYSSTSYSLAHGIEIEVLSTQNSDGTEAIDLTGNDFGEYINGNMGNNVLNGGGGIDAMYGYGGDDVFYVDLPRDLIFETIGQGFDRIYASTSYSLDPGVEIEFLNLTGSGEFTLLGNEFGQYLYGNEGGNRLDGGLGMDSLTGGGGADQFLFTTALGGGNADFITDFQGGLDKIALDDAIFAGLTSGEFAGAFVIGPAAQDSDDRIIYNSSTGQMFYDADGNGTGAAVLFATLRDRPALSASDFIVI